MTINQFCLFFLRRLKKTMKERHSVFGKVVKNLEDWFNAFDRNHDGEISIEEFWKVVWGFTNKELFELDEKDRKPKKRFQVGEDFS